MADTPWLTYDDFHSLLGEAFDVVVDDEPAAELTLQEATPHGPAPDAPAPGARQAFALVFTGPPSPALSQGTWDLRHPDLGTVAIFLVPIGPGPDGPRYEAIFS